MNSSDVLLGPEKVLTFIIHASAVMWVAVNLRRAQCVGAFMKLCRVSKIPDKLKSLRRVSSVRARVSQRPRSSSAPSPLCSRFCSRLLKAVIFHLCVGCQVEKVDARGVQLAALFMAGVDTALFINDVCGQPLPWEHCCPWGFFDGKLFQSKLARAARDRAALLDMCEGQVRSRASQG